MEGENTRDEKTEEVLIVKPTISARGHMQLEAEVDIEYVFAPRRFFSGIFEDNGKSFHEHLHTTSESDLLFYEEELKRGGLEVVGRVKVSDAEISELNSLSREHSYQMSAVRTSRDNYFSSLKAILSGVSEGVER